MCNYKFVTKGFSSTGKPIKLVFWGQQREWAIIFLAELAWKGLLQTKLSFSCSFYSLGQNSEEKF